MNIEDFADKTPELKPEVYLNGRLEGWGVLESILGGLQSRYTVAAEGRWDAAAGVLHFTETWSFDNGHVDTLNWQIRPLNGGRYSGSETRIEGEAAGEAAGCAFHWQYSRDTPQPDGSSSKLSLNDWFFRIDEKVVIVKGTASKLGIPFASAHVTYRKLG